MSHDDTKAARELVNQLLDDLEARGWEVRDYNPRVDPYEPIGLELDIERSTDHQTPDVDGSVREGLVNLREVVENLDEAGDKRYSDPGVPVEDIVVAATEELFAQEGDVRRALEELQAMGEVYEPTDGHYRVT